jgi:hypothetical protein
MWKVLGVEGTIPAFAEIWKQRMIELSKRKKDEADLIRLAEDHPAVRAFLPEELRRQLPPAAPAD